VAQVEGFPRGHVRHGLPRHLLNLEDDETGVITVIVSPYCFIPRTRTITSSAALIIRGRVDVRASASAWVARSEVFEPPTL
jgi:hypothetical protein